MNFFYLQIIKSSLLLLPLLLCVPRVLIVYPCVFINTLYMCIDVCVRVCLWIILYSKDMSCVT